MDERISRLTTPEECEQLALNVEARLPGLAREARCRAVTLRAKAHHATSEVEHEVLEAIYAYQKAKNAYASRIWPMLKCHGIIGTVERLVKRKHGTAGYKALLDMGMQEFAFEAVVCRHPGVFSPEALKRSQDRLKEWGPAQEEGKESN